MDEMEVFLHADNCTGQDKNNTMLQCIAWGVITRQHTKIMLSLLVVCHTKFAPDCALVNRLNIGRPRWVA